MEYILRLDRKALTYETVPKYPSIVRDVAFVVSDAVHAGNVQAEIKRVGAPLVKRVEAFDVYTGDNLNADEKSISFNIHYQNPQKTLTDEEVDASIQAIITAIKESFGGYVRS